MQSRSYIYAVEAESGKVIWTVRPEEYGTAASPIIKDNLLYMAGEDSNIYAIKLDEVGFKPAGGKPI